MLKFRKKPVVIEAENYGAGRTLSSKFTAGAADGTFFYAEDGTLQIKTLKGTMTAIPGDWVIRGVKGEFYPCRPDIFVATYDWVPEAETGEQR